MPVSASAALDLLQQAALWAFGAALLAGVVAVALWGPPLWTALRRARLRARPFPAAWRAILRQRMPAYARLPADLQLCLKGHVQVLLAEVPVIGCAGFEVDDEVRVLVAAQAALLLLGRPGGGFVGLKRVLVYPAGFVVQREHTDALGLARVQRQALAGESHARGDVVLSWADVQDGAAVPDDGRNVVLHEFAHQLDQAHGGANGMPWLPGAPHAKGWRRARAARWAAVMQAEFAALGERVARGAPGLIDPYGATAPAEFFAVCTELFFERPQALAEAHPRLYAEFADAFRVHPLSWN
jgi:Mlc titration factor MtfA (ptsG expression regulator)